MSREAFETAAAALVEATRPGKANLQVATTANRTLLAECEGLDQPTLNLALSQLAEGLAVRGVEHPALLATACAALVERGGNPRIALDPLLNRLEESARDALAFVRACRVAAGAPADGPADEAACLREHGADVAEQNPKRGWAWRNQKRGYFRRASTLRTLSKSVDGPRPISLLCSERRSARRITC